MGRLYILVSLKLHKKNSLKNISNVGIHPFFCIVSIERFIRLKNAGAHFSINLKERGQALKVTDHCPSGARNTTSLSTFLRIVIIMGDLCTCKKLPVACAYLLS